MKEIFNKEKDKIKNIKDQVLEIQKIFINNLKPKKGHTLFEINIKENTINKAVFDKPAVLNWNDAKKGLISSKKEITIKENCIYISALNEKNALKKLNNQNK
jgi:hypothetical protein